MSRKRSKPTDATPIVPEKIPVEAVPTGETAVEDPTPEPELTAAAVQAMLNDGPVEQVDPDAQRAGAWEPETVARDRPGGRTLKTRRSWWRIGLLTAVIAGLVWRRTRRS